MAKKSLLIYENAVPLSKEVHRNLSVDFSGGYGFAAELNTIPIVAEEFPLVATGLPIIFAQSEKGAMPSALVGLRNNENLCVSEDGQWQGRYLPAFLRRYPFVFSKDEGKSNYVLCIDSSFSGLNDQGKGDKLFDDNGEASEFTKDKLGLTTSFQKQFQITRDFGERLVELDLLRDGEAQFQTPSGDKGVTKGFMTVDHDKLMSLSEGELGALAKSGDLELIHIHIQSLRNVEVLGRALIQHLQAERPDASSKDT